MKRRTRIQYTDSHKALMWDRWRQGESLHQIARLFDQHHSSVRGVFAETGGIRPAVRRRSTRALVAGHTIRLIASLFQLTDGERHRGRSDGALARDSGEAAGISDIQQQEQRVDPVQACPLKAFMARHAQVGGCAQRVIGDPPLLRALLCRRAQ
ncbi:hypothetical protein IFT65_14625 [Stenotrophomonas sp. CFBP 13725]|nr:hypothetical protein [Stenotrophomonas sp. CFBP 13725]